MRLAYLFSFITIISFLSACSSKEDYIERPVDLLYNQAMDDFLKGSYKNAAPKFQEVERQHPYSLWAVKAQLMAAFSFYANDDYDEAVDILDKFIQLRPGDKDIAYAYYLKALCFYERISDVGRDQKMTEFALKTFDELTKRFPDTSYAKDARAKMHLTYDHLAGKEMEIGRFYMNRGQYTAALGRFKRVYDQLQTTSHIEEAIYRLVECHLALGVKSEAQKMAAVLGFNYPASIWYRYAYDLLVLGGINPKLEPKAWWEKPWKNLL